MPDLKNEKLVMLASWLEDEGNRLTRKVKLASQHLSDDRKANIMGKIEMIRSTLEAITVVDREYNDDLFLIGKTRRRK